MKYTITVIHIFFISSLFAQSNSDRAFRFANQTLGNEVAPLKLFQRNHGAIVGLQRAMGTSLEFGYEAHWRKISLTKPRITGATANMEYDVVNHVMGYKAGIWMKRGRVNLTWGGNLVYFNNFNGLQKYGIGPAVGFRLAGFHLTNGYNLLIGDREFKPTTLYISLRYYFPVDNKFVWDRKKGKGKSKVKVKDEDEGDRKGIKNLLNL